MSEETLPFNGVRTVPCPAKLPVEIAFVKTTRLDPEVTVRSVRRASVTVLNAASHYSSRNVGIARWAANVSRGAGDSARGAYVSGAALDLPRTSPLAALSDGELSPWRLFAHDLLQLRSLLVQAGLPNAAHRLVFRTTPPGHPGCAGVLAPYATTADAFDALWRGSREDHDWHLFASYDAMAREVLRPLGVDVLDVVPLTLLRPDAHTQVRYNRGFGPPDCLHHALPGVPDVWNRLLLSRLDSCR